MKRVAFRWLLVLILCLTLLPTVVLAETDDITPIEPDKDENGVYQISNANELYGFAEIVNDLQNEDSWNPHANAVLTADITVNEGVLKPDGTLNTEKRTLLSSGHPSGIMLVQKVSGTAAPLTDRTTPSAVCIVIQTSCVRGCLDMLNPTASSRTLLWQIPTSVPEIMSAVCVDGMNTAPSPAASTKAQSSAPLTTALSAACAGIVITATSKNAPTLAQLSV